MTSDWSISGVDLHLDPAAPAPGGRRAWLESALRSAVRDGRLTPGTRLPPSRTLAGELGVARGTVTAAYDQLAAEGYLTARRGAGTVVADLMAPLTGFARSSDTALDPSSGLPPLSAGSGWFSEPAQIRHDLIPGRPDVASFPVETWVRAARRVLPRVQAETFANGDPRGLPVLRRTLSDYLGRARGVRTDPDTIVVTSGVMQGIGLLAEVLHRADVRKIAMEEPSLPFHQEALRRRGLEVIPLMVDDLGARCEFDQHMGEGEIDDAGVPGARDHGPTGAVRPIGPPRGAEVGATVLTPAHQAGFGVVLAPERRRAFVEWARSTGGLIIEDDYDGEFRYDRQPIGAMQGMAPEQVAYLGTVSKTLAPGLRIGWMVLPPELVPPVAEAKFYTDVQNEVIGQIVLAELMQSLDYDRHVRAARQRYRNRRDALLRRLRVEVPQVRVHGAAAGVQLLLELPTPGPSEEVVLAEARRRGLRLAATGGIWQQPDHPPCNGIGVGYGTPPEHAYPAALDALLDTLKAAFADY